MCVVSMYHALRVDKFNGNQCIAKVTQDYTHDKDTKGNNCHSQFIATTWDVPVEKRDLPVV